MNTDTRGGIVMLEVYKNIKKRRKELGLSQEELAKKTGYTNRSSIAKIENGEVDIPQSKILAFAKVLQIPAGDLMGETENYYIDPQTAELAQEIFDNKQLRLLINDARDAAPEDIRMAHEMLLALKRKEQND